ncbi:protein ITPRID1 [Rhineura floridana]|uniref:protein ITPRID1 n=1 Tax=Rhineura floridana TaxID=261503 RepID=UPI002AC863D6|nr:protein ITPRID1 [Rhineura floridana]XP_061442112.1 protein ITPRID1 [Rhineura floridana]
MSSESHHHGINNNTEKKKRGLLLSTRMSWTQLDEDFPAPKAVVDNPLSPPYLVDHKEENFCNWMDSGFCLSASRDLQESRNKAAALAPPSGLVQMTVQNYMRSLHQFSEMPVLSRWNSVGSSHSLSSEPKSVTEWLDFWEKDPVEILLDLGFGTDEPDICTKIPSRFISCASMAKGINIRVFIEAQRQRVDVENPNLCGRFRQLQVLDHVTSAFSSLLSDINTMQQKSGERAGEKSTVGCPMGKAVITPAKRRRIGQLLRKVSRQTTMHGPQAYRNAVTCQAKEDHSADDDADLHMAMRTGLSENLPLICLKEELFPSAKEAMTVSQTPRSIACKPWVLPHLPMKQPHLPSTSEMSNKERPRKEPNVLLTHRFRRVSSLNCKPSDSFEMEEIQSFEDESSWGNPLESTSDVIVTRTNSCQSDSSGFLEEPSEPLPLQGLPLPGNLRLSCNSSDCQAFLRHKKDSPLVSQDLLPTAEGSDANISRASGSNVVLLRSLSREHTFQGEEIFYSINEEDDLYGTCNGQSENTANETLCDMDEKEMQSRRGQWEEGDRCVQDCISHGHTDNMNQIDICPPERKGLPSCHEKHQSASSVPEEESCKAVIVLSSGQICEDTKGREEPLVEGEEGRDICKEGVLESIAECVEGKCSVKGYGKLDSSILVAEDVTSECQGIGLNGTVRPLDISRASKHDLMPAQPEINVSSRSPLRDSSLSPYCFEKGEIRSLDILSPSAELDEEGGAPGSEINTNLLKSVTVQMPSRLVSNMRSISLGETSAKGQSLDFTSKVSQSSKDEPPITSVPGASKEEDTQMREASIQTDRSQRKKETLALFHFRPSFQGHGHLVKSASLDTGLYGKYRSCCHKSVNAWCAQHRGHCYPLISHNCCLLCSLLLAPSGKHPVACCSSHAIELQLLKTLKLLQDTAMRNISSCTVHEIEVMRSSCQRFRERLDEIEQHLVEQEALFSSAMSSEGREEKRQLQVLRQAVRREVAELEGQLQDRARQVREGILMQLNQLLGEQSKLCSELGISDWMEETEAKNGGPSNTLPDADAAFFSRAGCSKGICHRHPSKSARVPSSSSESLLRQTELKASTPATSETNLGSDPKELHTSKKEVKGPSQPKIDFKAFIQNLKKSFRNSFSNDAAEGKD